MRDLEKVLNLLGKSLKTMSQGINAIAEQVDEIAEVGKSEEKEGARPAAGVPEVPKPKTKPAKTKPAPKAAKPKAKKKPAAKKAPAKPAAKKGKPASASATVLDIINNSPEPLNNAAIMEKTGYDKRKVQNILFNLKKAGKIKSAGRGLYGKV